MFAHKHKFWTLAKEHREQDKPSTIVVVLTWTLFEIVKLIYATVQFGKAI